ncbi:MAG: phytoene desaturase family protein [Solirubrobacteraceae bacterium]
MGSRLAVIGAGHHGLIAAVTLAERGNDVTVLEAAPHPGGAVHSAQLTLPGFVHDTCSGFFPLAAASPPFRDLDLDVEWVNPPVPMVQLLDEEGGEIALHRDVAATARSLDACAPGAGAAWADLVATLWPHRHRLLEAGLARLPPVRSVLELLAGLRGQAMDLAPLALRSAATIGQAMFADDRATAWLASSGIHADLSPQAPGSGVFALALDFLAHVVGWPFPRGGAGQVTDALVARLHAAGGELRCAAPVVAIELRRRRVMGVRLASGERVVADRVICTASPATMMRMLPADAFGGWLGRRLRGWRYGLGTVKLDYALSGAVPWAGEAARDAAVVHLGGDIGELVDAIAQAGTGRFPDRPAVVVGQHTVHDRSRAPAGAHTLYAYARVPQRPGLSDDEMARRLEDQIERFAPGFRALVLGRSVRSPAALEAENRSLCGGDLAAGSCELDQQAVFRPAPSLCRGRTPLRGLYVAGAWVHPGPGVHGVSGRAAADAVSADAHVRWRR